MFLYYKYKYKYNKSNEHECTKTTRFCIEKFDLQSKVNRIASMKNKLRFEKHWKASITL